LNYIWTQIIPHKKNHKPNLRVVAAFIAPPCMVPTHCQFLEESKLPIH
jgi:hypothetical protein